MAERLYIRHPNDLPHAEDDETDLAKCGALIVGAKKITELQALVWLKNARCAGCFPGWTTGGHGVRHG